MDSPFTAPDIDRISLDDEFDPIPQFHRRRSRSFDNASDIDFTYSEDVSNSPLATISFMSRNTVKGAPILPNVPQTTATTEGFTLNRPEQQRTPSPSIATRPEERQDRHLVYADYDLSEEEDDILIGEENSLLEDESENSPYWRNPLDISQHTAPNMPTEPLIPIGDEDENDIPIIDMDSPLEDRSKDPLLEDRVPLSAPLDTSHDTAPNMPTEPLIPASDGLLHKNRSASFSGLSPTEESKSNSPQVESLLDLSVPSLTPVPMRRVASTPSHPPDRQRRGMSMPPLGQGKLQSLPLSPRGEGSPLLRVQSPYSLTRQVSVPSRNTSYSLQRQSSTPTILFTDDPQKSTIGGDNINGIPKNSSNRAAGASIFRSGRIGNNLASPSGVVRTPSPTKAFRHQRRKSSERLTISAPYALRRHTSLPTRSSSSTPKADQNTSPAIPFPSHHHTERPSRIEFDGSKRNLRVLATTFNSPPKATSNSNGTDTSNSFRQSSIGSNQDEWPSVNTRDVREGGPTSLRKPSIGTTNDWPGIKESPTATTVDGLDSDYESARNNTKESTDRHRRSLHVDTNDDDDIDDMAPSDDGSKEAKIFFQRQKMRYILYLSAFSIFGSTIRVFLVRIFGLTCEVSDPTMDEFCVTATGRTTQRGGALFADLPANMVGCFIMGIMTSLQPDLWPPIPWFRPDHPLQQHDAYHVGIRTGLCGSITTFASWNAQMVVMMDGTNTELGSQVVTALFGYVIGFFCAIASFLVGTNVSTWITRWRNPEVAREDDEEVARLTSSGRMEHEMVHSQEHGARHLNRPTPTSVVALPDVFSTNNCCRDNILFKGHLLPFVLLAILLVGYAVGGFVMQSPFYRTMFCSSLLTPPGALLRWELSRWNSTFSELQWRRLHWLPLGTFVANVLASVVYISLQAVETRYLFDDVQNNIWAITLLTAIRTGFAGSLSTVSTMVKEMFELNAEFPHHAKPYQYAFLTVAVSVALCISVYSPIVRSS